MKISDPPIPGKHRTDIDGLRAVAVLSVLGFHTHTPGFSGGFVGVDVFFVISGYLICSILVREIEQGSFSIARFYERRCKRILPALFAVLLFWVALGSLILSPVELKHLGSGIMATACSVSNVQFYLQGSYFYRGGVLNPLLMTWSLAVEEQFYIVFPLLMLLLYKRSKRHLFATMGVLCCLSLALSIYTEFRHPEFNFYLPFTRAWELGAGTLFAVWQTHRLKSRDIASWVQTALGLLGLAMVAGCVVLYSPAVRFPGYEAIPPVLGTVLLLASPLGRVNAMLGWRPLTAVGLISYSLYLWHWPLLSFAEIIGPEPPSGVARAGLMLLAGVLATLSYRFIETPFRAARYRNRTRVLLTYASLLVGCFLLGLAVTSTSGLARRTPALAEVERSLEMERVHDCINAPDRGPILTSVCVPPSSGTAKIALLGDSHAEALAPVLRQTVAAAGEQLLVAASYSCPPLKGYTRSMADQPEFAGACARFNAGVLELLGRRTDVTVVVLAGAWAMVDEDRFVASDGSSGSSDRSMRQSGDNLIAGIAAEVRALEGQGKRVVVIDDIPSLGFTPIDRVRIEDLPVRRFLAQLVAGHRIAERLASTVPRAETITPEAEAVRRALLGLAANDPTLKVVDTKSLFCDESKCTYSDGGNLLYTDNNHVSRFGAAMIVAAPEMQAALGRGER